MKKKFLLLGILLSISLSIEAAAQRVRKATFRVCGNPNTACSTRSNFREDDIPFLYPKNYVVGESELFYIVVLKSVKLAPGADCEETKLTGREDIQAFFPNNKVFYARGCYSLLNNYYTNIPEDTIGLAVYAGRTKAEADTFLKRVKANKYESAYLKRIRTGFNGT
ncbi:MAG TPA: hypothetical protein VGQ55_16080 [Pyrinomonadaceae bacterium]|nr:hypothetical protein [Pyrinomonadaceae bacterium]